MENNQSEITPEKENSKLPDNEELGTEKLSEEKDSQSKGNGIFTLFVPREGYYITPIILIINIALFLLMVISGVSLISPDSSSLITWGANLRNLVLNGEIWRLLTSCFLHIGILHLLMNMYSLMIIGVLLEPLLGRSRFLLLYLAAGVISSIASIWWNEMTVSAGASGAIFGLFGASVSLFATDLLPEKIRVSLLKNSLFIVGINLLYGLNAKGIDNSAHIGGLIAGLAIGISFYPGLKKIHPKYAEKIPFAVVTILFILGVILTQNITNYTEKYDQMLNDYLVYDTEGFVPYINLTDTSEFGTVLQKLAVQEGLANELYSTINYFQKEQLLGFIDEKGIYFFRENLTLLDSTPVKSVFIKKSGISYYNTLVKYYSLRIESYRLISQYVKNKSLKIETTDDLLEYLMDLETMIWKENKKVYRTLKQEEGLPVSVTGRIELKEKFSSLLLQNFGLIIELKSNENAVLREKLRKNKEEMVRIIEKLNTTKDLFLK